MTTDQLKAADAIRRLAGTDALGEDAVVLGSGLGRFGETLTLRAEIAYEDIPQFPRSTVSGHRGRLLVGDLPNGRPILCMQGRMHYYEGYSAAQIALPVRTLHALGVERMLMTNAAGGIHPDFKPGDLMRIDDHINLTGCNPLIGPNDDTLGPRFPDMSRAWDPALGEHLQRAGERSGVPLQRGVYVQVTGPSFETPAEIRMLGRLGADAVGMSTVPEAITARHLGVRIAGISLITNYAAGLQPNQTLTLEEAMEEAAAAYERLRDLLLAYYDQDPPSEDITP
ncbi:MAG: purine-nucleoside phosphorylase [Pseudomonadota bacterium]